ncbi:MFS transporter [Nocardia sp. NPDC051030]|uniref:MFS transporter n=1 Tax=Nocardia sp. NPDC051030 TaxID=3155162 RepID=UPI00344429EF
MPFYALYALLFAAHGLNTSQISVLLGIWSATAFVLEIPSGAWADTVSRRGLLILSAILLAAGFAVWTVFPTFLGFAVGFVLWGTSSSLRSGTFEALLYDDLAERNATAAYSRVMGYTRAAAESAALLGILAAAPLYAWGGYSLIGWSSVAIAVVHTLAAMALPSAPKRVSSSDVEELEDAEDLEADAQETGSGDPEIFTPTGESARLLARYGDMLRVGLREALRVRVIRRGVVLVALLNGITAFDEYFALLADDAGVSPPVTAVLVGVTVAGALAGATLAGRTESIRARTMALALGVGGLLFIGGALLAGMSATHPQSMYLLTAVGFSAIGIAYGIDYNADVIASARLQDAIAGPARATVTSVSGFVSEVIALAVFAFVAVVSLWLPIPTVVALLGVPLLATAVLIPAWLPSRVLSEPVRK